MFFEVIPNGDFSELNTFCNIVSTGSNVTKLFCPLFTNFHKKLACLSLASFFGLVYCLQVRTELISVEHLSGTPPLGRLLALSANNRIGWKGLTRKNTLAYYEHS